MLTIKSTTVLAYSFFDVMSDDVFVCRFNTYDDAAKAIAYLNATEGY